MLRDSISPETRNTAERLMLERLFALPAWENAPLVCGYMPIQSEFRTHPIQKRAHLEGKKYALPVTLTDAREGQMAFRYLTEDDPHALTTARFNIAEPPATAPTVALSDFRNALVLVPGLAFDDRGYRIGYGGGYYDRFLARLKENHVPVFTVGLAFSVCRTATLPHDAYDIPVDFIIDERRITDIHGTH